MDKRIITWHKTNHPHEFSIPISVSADYADWEKKMLRVLLLMSELIEDAM